MVTAAHADTDLLVSFIIAHHRRNNCHHHHHSHSSSPPPPLPTSTSPSLSRLPPSRPLPPATHSLTHSPTHSLTHSLTHGCIVASSSNRRFQFHRLGNGARGGTYTKVCLTQNHLITHTLNQKYTHLHAHQRIHAFTPGHARHLHAPTHAPTHALTHTHIPTHTSQPGHAAAVHGWWYPLGRDVNVGGWGVSV